MPPTNQPAPAYSRDYQLVHAMADSLTKLPDQPIGPLQDAFGTYLVLWIECLEAAIDPTGYQLGLTLLASADIESGTAMRRAVAGSLASLPGRGA